MAGLRLWEELNSSSEDPAILIENESIRKRSLRDEGSVRSAKADKAGVLEEEKGREAAAWITAVTGHSFAAPDGRSFARGLKDGQALCRLINIISPGSIPILHVSHAGYKHLENIGAFLNACKRLGVAEEYLFAPADLHELRDTSRVTRCLYALGAAVQHSAPDFEGPHLGRAAVPLALAAGVATAGSGGSRLAGGSGVSLNMADVDSGRTTAVGSLVGELREPAPLSNRARQLCPAEVANSPRAIAANSDPVHYPPRSPAYVGLGAAGAAWARSDSLYSQEGQPSASSKAKTAAAAPSPLRPKQAGPGKQQRELLPSSKLAQEIEQEPVKEEVMAAAAVALDNSILIPAGSAASAVEAEAHMGG